MSFVAFNSSAGAPQPQGVEGNLFLQHRGACLSSFPIIVWSKGCLDLYSSDAPIKLPLVKTALPSKNEVCVTGGVRWIRISFFLKVLCNEGSQAWLRGLDSAAICQNSAFSTWRETLCLTPCVHLILQVSLTLHSSPVDEIPALVSSLIQAWIDLLRWRTARVQHAAAGHLLDSSSSARKTRFMQHLDSSAIWLFNELPFLDSMKSNSCHSCT